jgi:type II secretory pathway pseudopilin PulG
MNIKTANENRRNQTLCRESLLAFTIPEIMVSMAICSLVMAAVITTHVFGLSLYKLTKTKLGASDEARAAISLMLSEIRSAKILFIGNGNLTTFTNIAIGQPNKGTAIRIHPTTNRTFFIQYYWDQADSKLKRTTNGANYVSVVANAISNQSVFTAENYAGITLTNDVNNRVIGLTMQFFELTDPTVRIGAGSYYDFYQLSTRITRRTLE